MIAAVAPPGTPIINKGINVPEVTPLFEDSGAIKPSGCPVPYNSGVLEKFFDC